MRNIYIDRTEFTGAISVFSKDTEIISAGTTIYSMSVGDRNEEYQRYANDYDIQFIFDDYIPHLEFYTVPQVDIMAKDSRGGFIGTICVLQELSTQYCKEKVHTFAPEIFL